MPSPVDEFPFETFPRRPLPFKVTRRNLLSRMVTEFLAYTDHGDGKPTLRLADLGSLPDEVLADIVPIVTPGCRVTVSEDRVYCQPPQGPCIQLFRVASPAVTVWNAFNGQLPLSEAARALAEQTGWEPTHCFAYARGVFLALVMGEICQPRYG